MLCTVISVNRAVCASSECGRKDGKGRAVEANAGGRCWVLNKRTVVHVEFVERDEVVVDGREQKKKDGPMVTVTVGFPLLARCLYSFDLSPN